jgi:hypothetical protein
MDEVGISIIPSSKTFCSRRRRLMCGLIFAPFSDYYTHGKHCEKKKQYQYRIEGSKT